MFRTFCEWGKNASELQRSRAVCRIRLCEILGKKEERDCYCRPFGDTYTAVTAQDSLSTPGQSRP